MSKTNVTITMDSDLKKQFEELCSKTGISLTDAFTLFAKKAVGEDWIPCEIGEEVFNQETKRLLKKSGK